MHSYFRFWISQPNAPKARQEAVVDGVSDELIKLRGLVDDHVRRINSLWKANKADQELGKLDKILSAMLGLDSPQGW